MKERNGKKNKKQIREITEMLRARRFEILVKKVELDPEDKIMLEELLKDFK